MNEIKNHVSGWLYESQADFEAVDKLPRRNGLTRIYPPPEPLEYNHLIGRKADHIITKLLVIAGTVLLTAVIVSQLIMARG